MADNFKPREREPDDFVPTRPAPGLSGGAETAAVYGPFRPPEEIERILRGPRTPARDYLLAQQQDKAAENLTAQGFPYREQVRKYVEGLPEISRFAVEAAPSTLGALVLGAPGSLAGEAFAQTLGLTEESTPNLAASAIPAGRLAGMAAGAAGVTVRSVPSVRAAANRVKLEEEGARLATYGSKYEPKVAAEHWWQQIRRSNVPFTKADFPNLKASLDQLEADVARRGGPAIPEGRDLLTQIAQTKKVLFPPDTPAATYGHSNIPLPGATATPVTYTMDRILTERRALGLAIKAFEAKSGQAFGGSKFLFKGLAEDLEAIGGATATTPTAVIARVGMLALHAERREHAITRLHRVSQTALREVQGEGDFRTIKAAPALKELREITDPKSRRFDHNFTEAFKRELPEIKAFFTELNQLQTNLSATGAGSLVVRGRLAALGSMIGGLAGLGEGPLGGLTGMVLGGAGAMVATSAPERMTQLLLTPTGRKVLRGILGMHGGKILQRGTQAAVQVGRTGIGLGFRKGREYLTSDEQEPEP